MARYLPARPWRYLHGFARDSGGELRFLDPVEEEMLEAVRIYEDQSVGLGERFLDQVEGCMDLLLDRPYIGRRVGESRRLLLRKFPFPLIYPLQAETWLKDI